jgi:hypothetical protein
MKIYKDIIILFFVTAVVIAAVIFGVSYAVDIPPSLNVREKRFARFSYQKSVIAEKGLMAVANLKSPLEPVGVQGRTFPSEALAEIAPPDQERGKEKGGGQEQGQKLSLVLIKDSTRLAIVNGVVVKEGDMTQLGRVKKINKDGILLKDGEREKWLKIE